MANEATFTPSPNQIIITLEPDAIIADLKKAMKLMRGVASVRMAKVKADNHITPALSRKICKARKEYAKGETISCRTPEEMQQYFDSL